MAALCWIAVLLDGFDMVVLDVVLPSMMEDPKWELTAAEGTQISTAGLFGFSVLTIALGWVDNATLFLILRFLAGVGLGACMPTAISMVTEFRGRQKAGSSATLTTSGYHVGAVLTALLGLVITPIMVFLLPESPQYLLSKGETAEAARIAGQSGIELDDAVDRSAAAEDKKGYAALLAPKYRRNTLFIWATSFMGLLLVYGLNTWLPHIMRAADYDMGNAIGFLLVLNAGAI